MNSERKFDKFIEYSFYCFPILMILGNSFINLFSILLSIYALVNFKSIKELILSKNKIYILVLSTIIVIFPYNSINFENSLIKFFSFFRFVLMFFGVLIFLKRNQLVIDKSKIIYIFLISIIAIDVIKEYFTGTNIFGFYTDYSGRIASFTNDELIIGYIFCFTSIFVIDSFFKIKNDYYLLILIFFLLTISFIIGERSNFIKFFIIASLGYFVNYFKFNKILIKKFVKIFILFFTLLLIFFYVIKDTKQFSKIDIFKIRDQNINQIEKVDDNQNKFYKNYKNLIYNSKHTPHYKTAYEIFLNYPLFGIGLNNYGEEAIKKEYEDKRYFYTNSRASTHPHQLFFEIISEVGIIGLIFFICLFIIVLYEGGKSYIHRNNKNILPFLLLHIFFIFPILPSGSFFGSNYGVPFWLNLSIIVYFYKIKN